jgi:hypothetical protein
LNPELVHFFSFTGGQDPSPNFLNEQNDGHHQASRYVTAFDEAVSLLAFYLLIFMPLFLLFNTQTMPITLFYTQQHCYVSLKPYTLMGFEPGSSNS